MTTTKRQSGPDTQIAKVFDVLFRNVGLPVQKTVIMKETGLTHDQVSQALHGLKNRKGFDVETVLFGEVYRLRNARSEESAPANSAASLKRMFEEIGTTRTGVVVIQDSEGVLYRAEEM